MVIFLLNDISPLSTFLKCKTQNHFPLKSNGGREHTPFINENMYWIIMTQYAAGTVSATLNEEMSQNKTAEHGCCVGEAWILIKAGVHLAKVGVTFSKWWLQCNSYWNQTTQLICFGSTGLEKNAISDMDS